MAERGAVEARPSAAPLTTAAGHHKTIQQATEEARTMGAHIGDPAVLRRMQDALVRKYPKLAAANESHGFRHPRLVEKADPTYPPLLLRENIQGVVWLLFLIDAKGAVTEIETLSDPDYPAMPELVAAAKSAVARWRFSPAMIDGKPVPMPQVVPIVFQIPETDRRESAVPYEQRINARYADVDAIPDLTQPLAEQYPEVWKWQQHAEEMHLKVKNPLIRDENTVPSDKRHPILQTMWGCILVAADGRIVDARIYADPQHPAAKFVAETLPKLTLEPGTIDGKPAAFIFGVGFLTDEHTVYIASPHVLREIKEYNARTKNK